MGFLTANRPPVHKKGRGSGIAPLSKQVNYRNKRAKLALEKDNNSNLSENLGKQPVEQVARRPRGRPRSAKPILPRQPEQPLFRSVSPTLQSLPHEIIADILIYSGNLNLRLVCRRFATFAPLSPYIKAKLINEQLTDNGIFPAASLSWSWLTPESLKSAGTVTGFDAKYVPPALESCNSDSAIRLMAYALEHGCLPRDTPTCIYRLVERKYKSAVEKALDLKLKADHRSCIEAMQQDNEDLAVKLLELNEGRVGLNEIFAAASAHNFTVVRDKALSLISGITSLT